MNYGKNKFYKYLQGTVASKFMFKHKQIYTELTLNISSDIFFLIKMTNLATGH